jgi:TonB family protein
MKTLLLILVLSLAAFGQSAIVITPKAVFRERPSPTGKVLFTVNKGAKFKLESEENTNGWYFVSVLKSGIKGWIHGNNIEIQLKPSRPKTLTVMGESTIDDWLKYGESSNTIFFYDPSTVFRDKNIVNAWTKHLKNADKSYLQVWINISCLNKEFNVGKVTAHNPDGSLKASTTFFSSAHYEAIPQNAPVMDLAYIICGRFDDLRISKQGDSFPEPAPPVSKSITKGIINGNAISLPRPSYPPAARAVGVSGAVNVQVTISESGNVISATASSGHQLLRAAAEEAARGARFAPTLLSGQPVKVTGIIVYNFVP